MVAVVVSCVGGGVCGVGGFDPVNKGTNLSLAIQFTVCDTRLAFYNLSSAYVTPYNTNL